MNFREQNTFVYKSAIIPLKAMDLLLLHCIELTICRQNIWWNQGKKQIISKLIRRKRYKSLICVESTKPSWTYYDWLKKRKFGKIIQQSRPMWYIYNIYIVLCVWKDIFWNSKCIAVLWFRWFLRESKVSVF